MMYRHVFWCREILNAKLIEASVLDPANQRCVLMPGVELRRLSCAVDRGGNLVTADLAREVPFVPRLSTRPMVHSAWIMPASGASS